MGRGQLSKTQWGKISCGLFGVLGTAEKQVPEEIGNAFQLGIGDELTAIC